MDAIETSRVVSYQKKIKRMELVQILGIKMGLCLETEHDQQLFEWFMIQSIEGRHAFMVFTVAYWKLYPHEMINNASQWVTKMNATL